MSLTHLAPSLEPKLRELYAAHRERAAKIDWSYHEYLPLDELKATPERIPKLSPVVYTAVETALLTEINLPWFTSDLYNAFRGSLTILIDFLHTWTAEEDAHALLLETYLLLGGNGDTKLRSALRKSIIRQGWALNIGTAFGTIAYTAIQELATQTFYLRVAEVAESEDPMLARALRRLAKDETLHMCFYRDAVKAHLDIEPNYVYPLADVMFRFEMPGSGMPDFLERSEVLAAKANYGPAEYYSQVIDVLWRYWEIDRINPTLTEAREAQTRLIKHHQRLGRIASRWLSRREKKLSTT